MFMVMQTYRVRDKYRDQYLELIRRVAEADVEIGCVFYQVYENDDRKNEFLELMGFDSWSHYERIRRAPPTGPLEDFCRRIDEWIEGGGDAIETTHWKCVVE